MTKSEFEKLQADHQASGLGLEAFLKRKKITSKSYYYWKKKFQAEAAVAESFVAIQPICTAESIEQEPQHKPSMVTFYFPNGLEAQVSSDCEELLLKLFTQNVGSHV